MMLTSLIDSDDAAESVVSADLGSVRFGCNCSACAGSADNNPQGNAAPQFASTGDWAGQYAYTPATGGADSATLISGSQWSGADAAGKTVITYSFSTAASQYGGESAAYCATLTEFSAGDKALTRVMLDSIAAVCNVSFVEVADSGANCGVVRYAYSQAPNTMGYGGFSFFPSTSAIGGDVWLGKDQAAAQWDFFRPNLLLHETLHAIGLKHPFEGGATLASQSDIMANTVMSYSPIAGSTRGYLSKYPGEPMPVDVAALQALYGAASHNAGDTSYDLSGANFQSGFQSLWDSAGNDVLDASRVAKGVLLDLRDGARSDVGGVVHAAAYFGEALSKLDYTWTLAIAPGARIENAIGSAFDDQLVGNDLANVLAGGAGRDLLSGAAGDDILVGGGGDDMLDGGAGADTAAFTGSIANFKIEKTGDTIRVTDRLGGQGVDLMTGVEKLLFQDLSVDLTVQDAAAAVSQARLQAVVELYVGFFNRVPDAEGLAFWLQQMNEGMTTATVADHFYTAALQHSSLTGYSATMSNEDFVKVIYKNVLGRSSVDADGLAYWSGALAKGTETRGSLLDAILDSAHTFSGDAQYGYVADLLANKFEVGTIFAVDMGLTWNTPEQSITKGMQIAAAITPTDILHALSLIGVAQDDFSLSGA